jgi:hypothetical protein
VAKENAYVLVERDARSSGIGLLQVMVVMLHCWSLGWVVLAMWLLRRI